MTGMQFDEGGVNPNQSMQVEDKFWREHIPFHQFIMTIMTKEEFLSILGALFSLAILLSLFERAGAIFIYNNPDIAP